MSEQQLSGTTALVTGASRGFGRAIAAALVQAGAQVAGVARRASELAEVADELGPGASESGVPEYINRSLGDYLAGEKVAFIEGLEATDAFARRSQARPFIELPSDKQDAVLTSMESGSAEGFPNAQAFFNRARRLTLEGMFGDPYYGGNKNFAGWDLIRYPGPRLATSADDQKMGVDIKPYHHSAYGSGDTHGH